jgi:hypothetical protein
MTIVDIPLSDDLRAPDTDDSGDTLSDDYLCNDEGTSSSACDICEFNGFPNERVVYQCEGLRSEDEDGFIYKYNLYDYPAAEGKKIKHVHKYNRRLIDELVDVVLGKQTGVEA